MIVRYRSPATLRIIFNVFWSSLRIHDILVWIRIRTNSRCRYLYLYGTCSGGGLSSCVLHVFGEKIGKWVPICELEKLYNIC
jgi:hypothetical protein